MPTALTVNNISIAALADPSGTVGIAAGHKFANNGRVWLRIANSASNVNAIVSLIPGGTITAGTFIFIITLQIGANAPVTYTSAAISSTATPSTVATAVLAATQPNGNAMSADFPSGTVTGGGSALNSGTLTLTFAGTFAAYRIPQVSVDAGSVTGGGTVDARVSTQGAGNGIITVPGTPVAVGAPADQYIVLAPGTSWVGEFNPALVNQSGADANNAFIFYDVPANYTVTAFQLQ